MDRQQYFTLMKEVSPQVHEKVARYIADAIKSPIVSGRLAEAMMLIPKARAGKSVMRSMLTYLVFRALEGDPWSDVSVALAISEVHNIYMYLPNLILDNKQGIWNRGLSETRRSISEIALATTIFREILEKMVDDLDLSGSRKAELRGLMSLATTECSLGQWADLELTVDRADLLSNEDYFKLYEAKSCSQTGFPYALSAQIGAIIGLGTPQRIELAGQIGMTIGLGMHISNDFGDFADVSEGTGFKVYQDQYADLRNGRLSYPLWHMLKHSGPEDREYLLAIASGKMGMDPKRVVAIFHQTDTLGAAAKLLWPYIKMAKYLIHQLPPSESREMLSVMAGAIRSNKYLATLRSSRP